MDALSGWFPGSSDRALFMLYPQAAAPSKCGSQAAICRSLPAGTGAGTCRPIRLVTATTKLPGQADGSSKSITRRHKCLYSFFCSHFRLKIVFLRFGSAMQQRRKQWLAGPVVSMGTSVPFPRPGLVQASPTTSRGSYPHAACEGQGRLAQATLASFLPRYPQPQVNALNRSRLSASGFPRGSHDSNPQPGFWLPPPS